MCVHLFQGTGLCDCGLVSLKSIGQTSEGQGLILLPTVELFFLKGASILLFRSLRDWQSTVSVSRQHLTAELSAQPGPRRPRHPQCSRSSQHRSHSPGSAIPCFHGWGGAEGQNTAKDQQSVETRKTNTIGAVVPCVASQDPGAGEEVPEADEGLPGGHSLC